MYFWCLAHASSYVPRSRLAKLSFQVVRFFPSGVNGKRGPKPLLPASFLINEFDHAIELLRFKRQVNDLNTCGLVEAIGAKCPAWIHGVLLEWAERRISCCRVSR